MMSEVMPRVRLRGSSMSAWKRNGGVGTLVMMGDDGGNAVGKACMSNLGLNVRSK